MKKLFALLTITGFLSLGTMNNVFAQAPDSTTKVEAAPAAKENTTVTDNSNKDDATAMAENQSFTQVIKQKFIEGGPGFMGIVLICLILGLAIVIERIIYLNMASTNSTKLLNSLEDALNSGGIEAAKEVCRNTKGPIASIFYQGLDRSHEGIDVVEKSVESYGGVQMGLLEKGISWISLFIALAPMLGFLGTVVGMIQAFDAIAAAGDISPTVVASGIKVALITTVFGLKIMSNNKLFSIISYSLLGLSALVGVYFYLSDFDNNDTLNQVTGVALTWCYILLGLAVLAAVVFPIISMIKSPKNAKIALFGVVGLGIIFVISYTLAGNTEFIDVDGKLLADATASKLSGAGLISFYFLGAASILTVIYAEVSKMFK